MGVAAKGSRKKGVEKGNKASVIFDIKREDLHEMCKSSCVLGGACQKVPSDTCKIYTVFFVRNRG